MSWSIGAWESVFTHLNNAGEGFAPEGYTMEEALAYCEANGDKVLDRGHDGTVAVVETDEGWTLIGDSHGPWAVSVQRPMEGQWNVWVWALGRPEHAFVISACPDEVAAMRMARRAGAAQIQYGLDGEIVGVAS